jgi:hypothetical protein
MPYYRFAKLSLVKKERLRRIPGKFNRRIGTRRKCRLDEFKVNGEELRARGEAPGDISDD